MQDKNFKSLSNINSYFGHVILFRTFKCCFRTFHIRNLIFVTFYVRQRFQILLFQKLLARITKMLSKLSAPWRNEEIQCKIQFDFDESEF